MNLLSDKNPRCVRLCGRVSTFTSEFPQPWLTLAGSFPPAALKNTFHFNVSAPRKVICHLIMMEKTQRHVSVKCVRGGSGRAEGRGGRQWRRSPWELADLFELSRRDRITPSAAEKLPSHAKVARLQAPYGRCLCCWRHVWHMRVDVRRLGWLLFKLASRGKREHQQVSKGLFQNSFSTTAATTARTDWQSGLLHEHVLGSSLFEHVRWVAARGTRGYFSADLSGLPSELSWAEKVHQQSTGHWLDRD